MDNVKPFFRVTVIAETGIREKGDGEREKKEWSLQTGGGRRESGDGGASGARRRAANLTRLFFAFASLTRRRVNANLDAGALIGSNDLFIDDRGC